MSTHNLLFKPKYEKKKKKKKKKKNRIFIRKLSVFGGEIFNIYEFILLSAVKSVYI